MEAEGENYEQETFVGVSRRGRGVDDPPPTIEEAIEDAWEKAKNRPPGRDRVRVIEIVAFGSNPINVYRVTVS